MHATFAAIVFGLVLHERSAYPLDLNIPERSQYSLEFYQYRTENQTPEAAPGEGRCVLPRKGSP